MRVILLALAISVLLFGSQVLPQSPNGSIRGIVLDPDAKAIPEAEIIVVNDATGVKYVTSTNGEGIYTAGNLPPGPYRIQVAKFGFKALIKPDITLNVQDALQLNFTLEVGASSVVVTVEGGAPMINTTDATVSTVIDRQFAENLPLNGRSFQTLVYLTPGVVPVAVGSFDNGQFTVNGQRGSSNYWMVDGVGANIGIASSQPGNGLGGTLGSFSALGGTNSLVSVDAMQEFRIQTSTFAPEFGRTPGGQISIATRSGSSQFHGTAFDYLRNDSLDANNWFNSSVTPALPKARERQNDFGGTLGGPILKDRTFFFFSYEGLRLRLPITGLTYVPDLSARENALPTMQPYLNAYPKPNGNDDIATGIAQFNSSFANPATLDAYSLRVDHKLSAAWNLFARYNYSPSQVLERGGGAGALSVVDSNRITTQTGTVGATWTIATNLSNDLRFNYSRTNAESYSYMDTFGGAVPLSSLPFPSPFTTQDGNFGFYIFSLGTGEFITAGLGSRNVQRQVNLVDGFAWQRGSHSVKLGVDFRRLSPTYGPAKYAQGGYFSDVATSEAGIADYGGSVSSSNQVTLLLHNLGSYVQDSWRMTSRLMMTYGLRWDIDFAPSSDGGPPIPAVAGYNLADLSQLTIAPVGTPPFKTTYNNLAPRLGVAYQISQNPGWSTVFRGGFGVFYDLASSETGNLLANYYAPPFAASNYLPSTVYPFTSVQIAPPAISTVANLARIDAFNPNLKLPYTLEWNAAIEQSLGNDQSLSISYIGASGRRLLQTTALIQPLSNPDLGVGFFIDNTASSNYNALQAQFRRRLSGGFQALVSYTLAHSIDDASASSFGAPSNLGVPGAQDQNRGSSDFDIRNDLSVGLTYEIPFHRGNAVAKAILKGWSSQSFLVTFSAPPVDVADATYQTLHGGVYTEIRPDIVPGQPFYLYGAQYPGGKALNPAAFTNPPTDPITNLPLRQGNMPRNLLRGFGATQWDLAIHRDFELRESLKLQFRAEMFNVLNHPNFGPPYSSFGYGGFGVSTQTLNQSLNNTTSGGGGFNPLYQIGGPRSVQLALKLSF